MGNYSQDSVQHIANTLLKCNNRSALPDMLVITKGLKYLPVLNLSPSFNFISNAISRC